MRPRNPDLDPLGGGPRADSGGVGGGLRSAGPGGCGPVSPAGAGEEGHHRVPQPLRVLRAQVDLVGRAVEVKPDRFGTWCAVDVVKDGGDLLLCHRGSPR